MPVAALVEEEEAFNAVRLALRDSFHVFTKGVAPVGTQPTATPLTPEQCIQLLDVYLRLILETSDDAAAYVLSRTFQTEFFNTIVQYMFQPLVFNPTTASGYAAQQSFLDLRSAACKALNHVLLRSTSMGAEGIAASCFRAAMDVELMEQLLASCGNAAVPEPVRCSVAEAIFIFILRYGAEGKTLLLRHNGVAAVSNAIVIDSSTVVRNFYCSVLRELAESIAPEIASANLLSVCIKVMSSDSSADCRILCSEVLSLCLRQSADTRYLLMRPHDLLHAADQQFDDMDATPSSSPNVGTSASPRRPLAAASMSPETRYTVQEAVGKLLQTCALVASSASIEDFFDVSSQMQIASKMSRRIAVAGAPLPSAPANAAYWRAKVATATTMRFLIQYTPHRLAVGDSIINHFPSLSTLLKAVIDAGRMTDTLNHTSGSTELFDAYCVEVATAVALITAQSPAYRHSLQRELLTVPMWATTLKASLVSCLNKASIEFFGTIEILDATGVYLNALEGIEWSDANKPRRQSIVATFEKQESRLSQGVVLPHAPLQPPASATELEWTRRCRLTFVILNFGVHLALTLPEPSALHTADQHHQHTVAASSVPRTGRRDVSPGASYADAYATPGTPRGMVQGNSRHATPSRRDPLFPNASALRDASQGTTSRSALTAQEREALAVSFDKFNSSFQLTLQLAECYAKKQRDEAMFVPTGDGFVVRAQNLKNPWNSLVQRPSLRSWTVKDVADGDLFYFAIPFDDLNERSVSIVMEKAKRHLTHTKKSMVTAPQHAKGRRWFLYDSLNFIMPRTIKILEELRQMSRDHGDSNLRFPVFLFREKEMHLGERCLHPGNLIEVMDQVKFYFSQRPSEVVGVSEPAIVSLKRKIDNLKGRRLQAADVISPAGSDSDDDDGNAYRGHGAISSESEGDD